MSSRTEELTAVSYFFSEMEDVLEDLNGHLIKMWVFLKRNANFSLKSTFGLSVAYANEKKQKF